MPRADAQANRVAVLEAASTLFADRGAEVSYDEIAHAAKVGRATLYRHFPTRDELLAAVLDGQLESLERIADRLGAAPDRFFALFDACVEHKRSMPFIDYVTRTMPPQTLDRMRERFERMFERPLRDAQRAGLVRADAAPGDVRILLLMISSLDSQGRLEMDRPRGRELVENMLRAAA
jgi:AcrR family transcriptional regulator